MPSQRSRFTRRLVAVGLVALCGCQPAPVKIAFIGGLTGRGSDLAVDGRNGALLAIETLNAQGRQRYQLLVHDDEQRVEKGRADVATAASEGAAFAIGPMTSVMAIPM